MKILVSVYFLLIPSLLSGSVHESDPDSLFIYDIPEVIIEKERKSFFHEDKKTSRPDSLTWKVFSNSNLGELISMFTPAYINTSGGNGASSSMIFRGTNSHQTMVSWNGFLLNSMTLGTMDLSTIPSATVQDITVVHGASGSIAGSGNFGGSVLLENRADWNNRLNLGVQSEFGTYDDRHFSFSGKIGNPDLQYQLFAYSHQAENNFRYIDFYKNGNPVEKLKNNAVDNIGLVQNMFIRLPGGNKLEAGVWYQSKQKEIPGIMGSYIPSGAMQRDSSLRVYTKWTKTGLYSSFSLNTAIFEEYMFYTDGNPSEEEENIIDSRIHTGRRMGDLNYRLWLFDYLSLDAGMTLSSLSADISEYGEKITELQSAAITAIKLSLPGFTTSASIRKEFHSNTRIPLLFALGARKKLPFDGMDAKLSYSRQFRVPSFNDKYWQPGGNPNLLPESGHTADIGLVQNYTAGNGWTIVTELSGYISRIDNMISWAPAENNRWWEPLNTKEVSVRGLETSFAAKSKTDRYDISMGSSYNFSRPLVSSSFEENSKAEGNRLRYVPAHKLSVYANINSPKLFFGFTGNLTGSRYTTEDNNPLYQMPAFSVFNGYAGYHIKIGETTGRLQLKIMNLLNSKYQVVRAYPMPGRSFHLSFSVEFDQR
ncbi:MAG: TonB-dependent receptor [bacterium]